MGLFRTLGERVERFKQNAEDAADETFECRDCGAEFSTDYDECPDCGDEAIEPVE